MPKEEPIISEPALNAVKVNVDQTTSSKSGAARLVEVTLRRFKSLFHIIVLLPLYMIASLCLGTAIAPGIALVAYINELTITSHYVLRFWSLGVSVAAAYFIYGLSLVLVVPFFNFILRTSLKEWRGQYYSLEVIPWYIHNGLTCLVRYTFLELMTPTPFNLIFYRLMGMKIGYGTIINSSHISDPSMIELGKKVTIGGSATVVAHYAQGGYLIISKVKIGDRATIGLKCTIMGGVEIGEHAKILSNSFVLPKTKIPAGEIWGGVPAVKIEQDMQPPLA